jgi:hypothetical protein
MPPRTVPLILTLATTGLLVTPACSKGDPVTCGQGTIEKDGVCMVRPPTSNAAPPTPTTKTPALGCEAACMKVATCEDLNTKSAVVRRTCRKVCASLDRVSAEVKTAYMRCVTDSACSGIDACTKPVRAALAPTERKARADDPVIVLKARVRDDRYGISKNLSVSYKSNAKKVIDGIKLQYVCRNNFDEPVGSGRLISQDKLRPGKRDRGVWSIHDDQCTKVTVTATSVHYIDGDRWSAAE